MQFVKLINCASNKVYYYRTSTIDSFIQVGKTNKEIEEFNRRLKLKVWFSWFDGPQHDDDVHFWIDESDLARLKAS